MKHIIITLPFYIILIGYIYYEEKDGFISCLILILILGGTIIVLVPSLYDEFYPISITLLIIEISIFLILFLIRFIKTIRKKT